jgi:hypothetical protein
MLRLLDFGANIGPVKMLVCVKEIGSPEGSFVG